VINAKSAAVGLLNIPLYNDITMIATNAELSKRRKTKYIILMKRINDPDIMFKITFCSVDVEELPSSRASFRECRR